MTDEIARMHVAVDSTNNRQ